MTCAWLISSGSQGKNGCALAHQSGPWLYLIRCGMGAGGRTHLCGLPHWVFGCSREGLQSCSRRTQCGHIVSLSGWMVLAKDSQSYRHPGQVERGVSRVCTTRVFV